MAYKLLFLVANEKLACIISTRLGVDTLCLEIFENTADTCVSILNVVNGVIRAVLNSKV